MIFIEKRILANARNWKSCFDLWFDSALLLKDINGKGLDLFNEDLDYAKKTKSYYFSNNIVFYRQRNKKHP
jgi:hypothetical protein